MRRLPKSLRMTHEKSKNRCPKAANPRLQKCLLQKPYPLRIKQVGSSASTELGFGSDGRPLYDPEGSIFPTNSHESDKIAKNILTGLEREINSRIQDPSPLLEDLKGLGMAGNLSNDGRYLTLPFEDVHRLVTTTRMAEVILNERVQNSRKAKLLRSRLNLMRNIVLTCQHS
jgi:hypothetical protein